MQASSALIAGDSVMAYGGFSGSDQSLTPTRLADLVETGQLRFILAGNSGRPGPGDPGGPGAGSGTVSTLASQVCTRVQAAAANELFDCQGHAPELRTAKA